MNYSDQIDAIYDSPAFQAAAITLSTTHELDVDKVKQLLLEGKLGIYTEVDIFEILCDIGPETLDTKGLQTSITEAFAALAIPATPAEAALPEDQADTVTPLRTMADDMEKVHGYGALAAQKATHNGQEAIHQSAQETILGKPHLAKTPTYETTPEEVD